MRLLHVKQSSNIMEERVVTLLVRIIKKRSINRQLLVKFHECDELLKYMLFCKIVHNENYVKHCYNND